MLSKLSDLFAEAGTPNALEIQRYSRRAPSSDVAGMTRIGAASSCNLLSDRFRAHVDSRVGMGDVEAVGKAAIPNSRSLRASEFQTQMRLTILTSIYV